MRICLIFNHFVSIFSYSRVTQGRILNIQSYISCAHVHNILYIIQVQRMELVFKMRFLIAYTFNNFNINDNDGATFDFSFVIYLFIIIAKHMFHY